MPDPLRKTVSASQVGALFGVSPFATPFTLWHELAGIETPDTGDDARQYWGRTLEPAILHHVQRERDLLVTPNQPQTYTRHESEPVGCTEDAGIWCPNRGAGVVEVKCVDWMQFADRWSPDQAPPHVELQVQAQLGVLDRPWGIIAVLVGGNEYYEMERERDPEVWGEICTRARAFLATVEAGAPPDVAGLPGVEDPFIASRWPRAENPEPLDMRDDPDMHALVKQYDYWTLTESMAKKERAKIKTQLLRTTEDRAELWAWGRRVKVTKSQTPAVEIALPDDLAARISAEMPGAGLEDLAADLLDWRKEVRRAGVTTRINVRRIDNEPDESPPWADAFDGEIVP